MKLRNKIIFIILFFAPLVTSIFMYSLSQAPIKSPDDEKIKFMTYNIHFGQGMDDKLNMERIAENILLEDPDILGLQEVENGRITSGGVDMATWLANRLNMYYYYYPSENEHQGGLALLSKYPIISTKSYDIPSVSSQRVMIHCVVEIDSDLEIDVFVTHLGLTGWNENLRAQVDYVLDKIDDDADSSNPHILMGDFNLENDTTGIENIIEEGFDDTYLEYNEERDDTFPTYDLYGDPDESIDYIFARDYDDIKDSYLVDDMIKDIDDPAEFGADHIPVVSILTF